MKINDQGEVVVSFYHDILPALDHEAKVALAQDLCMEDTALDYLVSQLTEAYAGESVDSHLHRARLGMIEKMPLAAVQLIRALLAEVNRAKAEAEHYRSLAWEMGRRWPRHLHCQACDKGFDLLPPPTKDYPTTPCPSAEDLLKKCGFDWIEVTSGE